MKKAIVIILFIIGIIQILLSMFFWITIGLDLKYGIGDVSDGLPIQDKLDLLSTYFFITGWIISGIATYWYLKVLKQ